MQTCYKANDDNAKPVLSTFPNFGEAILSGYGSHKIAKSQALAAIRSTSTAGIFASRWRKCRIAATRGFSSFSNFSHG